jgi:hypothetical protein
MGNKAIYENGYSDARKDVKQPRILDVPKEFTFRNFHVKT